MRRHLAQDFGVDPGYQRHRLAKLLEAEFEVVAVFAGERCIDGVLRQREAGGGISGAGGGVGACGRSGEPVDEYGVPRK